MLQRLIRSRLNAYRWLIAAALGLQAAAAVATLFLPALYARIIDNGVLAEDRSVIWHNGDTMIALTAMTVACSIAAVYLGARVAMNVSRDLRRTLFEKILSLSSAEIDNLQVASLVTRNINDVQQVQFLVLTLLNNTVTAPLLGIGSIVLALRQDLELSAILVVVLPVTVVIAVWIVRKISPLFRRQQSQIDGVNRIIREQITGVRVIRAFVRDDLERARFAKANDELSNVALTIGRLLPLMSQLVLVVVNVAIVALFWLGAHRIQAGSLSVGALVALVSYLLQILGATFTLINVFVVLPRATVSAERIQEVLDTPSGLARAEDPVVELSGPGHIELCGVSVHRPGAQAGVLEDVNLMVPPGKVTAVVGATGSGKSTLIALMCRLLDPTSGSVLVNDVDAREIEVGLMARTVGLIPQRPYLLSGTIRHNLRYGRADATDEELWHALEVAQAGFVRDLPQGLDAPVSQGGANFSGGERQRIAIARALVARPQVYLFDDSFSALDYATDVRIRQAFAREIGDSTVVIVAQRVSTVRDVTQIVVLDAGRIVGIGTHDDLLATCDPYRELVNSQPDRQEMMA